MQTATLSPGPVSSAASRRWRPGLACCALLAALAVSPARAQEGEDAGRVIAVPLPIATEGTNRLRGVTRDSLERFEAAERDRDPKDRRVFKLVYDFNPEGKENSSKDFGSCYELAKYLRGLQERGGVRTVAFVHGLVTRHSVLPVLACSEVVFSRGAQLGDVSRDPGEMLTQPERVAYEDVARGRYPALLVRKMYDRDLVVARGPRGDKAGEPFRAGRARPGDEVVLGPGNPARYSFAQAREFGLCQQEPRETTAEVAAAYRLPRSALDPDPLLGSAPVVWLIGVDGELTGALKERLDRRVRKALGLNANLLIFRLRCHGGDGGAAFELGNYLASLNDPGRGTPVKTVAYLTEESSDTAAFLALGCNQIVMDRKARLGDFDRFLQADPTREGVARKNLEELAARQHYPAALAAALLDREAELYWAVPTRGGPGGRLMTKKDLDGSDGAWRGERRIKGVGEEGRCLTLDAPEAKELGVARDVVDGLDALYRLEGVDPSHVHDASADRDWLDALAHFLRDPWTRAVLVMLGITCLILELKMPGVGLPGIIAAVCFVLFFWSHSQLNGQITWLALLLFVLGLLLIGLEVFVLPGLAVAGISGTVLVLGSLGLVAYGHWPQSNEEWVGLGRTIGPFGLSVLGALAAAVTLARFLPSLPFANRLMLKPQGEAAEFGEDVPDPSAPEHAALLGAIGVAATPLRPAGKVQFGDDFVDVVAEGGYVAPGTRVQVVELEGRRVVVKEV